MFLVLRWMTLEKVLGVGAARRWRYLATMALGVGPTRRCLVLLLQWPVAPFPGDVNPWAYIFVGVLIVWVPTVLVLEALGHGFREPGPVPSWVSRLGRNRCPSVP
jgi:hypothetical protein